jgi:hypothetical protein
VGGAAHRQWQAVPGPGKRGGLDLFDGSHPRLNRANIKHSASNMWLLRPKEAPDITKACGAPDMVLCSMQYSAAKVGLKKANSLCHNAKLGVLERE